MFKEIIYTSMWGMTGLYMGVGYYVWKMNKKYGYNNINHIGNNMITYAQYGLITGICVGTYINYFK